MQLYVASQAELDAVRRLFHAAAYERDGFPIVERNCDYSAAALDRSDGPPPSAQDGVLECPTLQSDTDTSTIDGWPGSTRPWPLCAPHRRTSPTTTCTRYASTSSGSPAMSGTSHAVFKTPWPGDPRVNIQKSKGSQAKPYQVRQALKAIDKLNEEDQK